MTNTPTTIDRQCLCGCGLPVSGKSRFLVGHDSRFYSLLARYQVSGPWSGFEDLPSATQSALAEYDLPRSKQRLKKRWETDTTCGS